MKSLVVSSRKLKSLLRSAYEHGANEAWSFEDWINEQIEDIRNKNYEAIINQTKAQGTAGKIEKAK